MSPLADRVREALTGSRSLRLGPLERFFHLRGLEGIAVVGSSCTGKSTLVCALREAQALRERIDVLVRYVTRAPRDNESPGENRYLDEGEFQARVDRGELGLRWQRPMPGGATRYGFALPRPGALPVYSANNALYSNAGSVRPEGALQGLLLVGVVAPDSVRAARLSARSPDLLRLRPEEAAARLSEHADVVRPQVHLVVENHGALEALTARELVYLIDRLTRPG